MMPRISLLTLVLDTNHENGKQNEEEEVAQAHTQNRLRGKPLRARCLCKGVDPCTELELK